MTEAQISELSSKLAGWWTHQDLSQQEENRKLVLATLATSHAFVDELFARLTAEVAVRIYMRTASTPAMTEFLDNIYQPLG